MLYCHTCTQHAFHSVHLPSTFLCPAFLVPFLLHSCHYFRCHKLIKTCNIHLSEPGLSHSHFIYHPENGLIVSFLWPVYQIPYPLICWFHAFSELVHLWYMTDASIVDMHLNIASQAFLLLALLFFLLSSFQVLFPPPKDLLLCFLSSSFDSPFKLLTVCISRVRGTMKYSTDCV